ncbi:MAG: DUF4124 domain-containing protein [Methylophaga sp.]|nr:DUF4124 domain-containing protein [Methylophaga sp.]
MKYLWLCLVLFVLPLNAEIYRWQDESGRIIYSDQYHPDAEIVKVTKSTNYKPPVINNIPDEPETEEAPGYQVSILSPQEGEAIWANGIDGNLPVTVDLQPELNIEKGEKLLISLDGAIVGEPQSSTSFNVSIIERGAHTISVSLINEVGVTLATSQSINFQLHRASVQ